MDWKDRASDKSRDSATCQSGNEPVSDSKVILIATGYQVKRLTHCQLMRMANEWT
jgi:hypothetical protein